jgi:hypothetical protein
MRYPGGGMSLKIGLRGFAGLSDAGMYSVKGLIPWEPGQKNAGDVHRQQVLAIPYPSFGKLTLIDRLAFSASCLLFSHHPIQNGDKTAICMGIPFGSLSTDLLYADSIGRGIPSPAYFSATLPSSALSETAIHFKLKGPNRVFCHTQTSGLWALGTGVQLIRSGKADTVLMMYVSALEANDRLSTLIPSGRLPFSSPSCYAFLLDKMNPADSYELDMAWEPSATSTPRLPEENIFEEIAFALSHKQNAVFRLNDFGIAGHLLVEKEP